jgi:formylglycine-generating enzyme required for sulfatase activity
VAAQCILESHAGIRDRQALLLEIQNAWLPRLTNLDLEPAPEARAAIGRALGRLNLDNRPGVGLRPDGLPDIQWVAVPAGEFLYQQGERRKLAAFQIARFPVTNAQFQAFLDAKDGYADDRWWKGLLDPDRQPRTPRWTEPNHPRETVDWHEAMAFCAWLGHHLKLDMCLPTEWQWERAARGTDGREFPWGNGYLRGCANIDETFQNAGSHYLDRTSTVGIYPAGASAEGVMDPSGNVWEWCLNEFAEPDRVNPGGNGSRILRGGSWSHARGGARGLPQRRPSGQPQLRIRFPGSGVVSHPLSPGGADR